MRATTKEQGFYSQIFKLVLPIVIQNLLSAAVNSADVVMLNYVGQFRYFRGIPGSPTMQMYYLWFITDWEQEQHFCVPSTLEKAICEQFRLSRESHFDSPSSSPSLWQELLLPCHR